MTFFEIRIEAAIYLGVTKMEECSKTEIQALGRYAFNAGHSIRWRVIVKPREERRIGGSFCYSQWVINFIWVNALMQLAEPNGARPGVPTLLAGKATLTAFILGLIGFLVTFVVRGLKNSIETLELFDRAIKGELGECENRFNELTKDKLRLEIDLRDSKVCLEETKSALGILGAVTLRFENRDSDALFTKEIKVTFHRHGIVDVRPAADIFAWFGIIRITSDGVDIENIRPDAHSGARCNSPLPC